LFLLLEYLKSVKLDDEERKSIIEAVESCARELKKKRAVILDFKVKLDDY